MPDDLYEPTIVPEIFVDGFAKHASHDGVMSCVGYRKRPDGRLVVVRLTWPAVNTNAAIDEANAAMADAATPAQNNNRSGRGKRGVH